MVLRSRLCVPVHLRESFRQAPAGAGWQCRGEPFQNFRTILVSTRICHLPGYAMLGLLGFTPGCNSLADAIA